MAQRIWSFRQAWSNRVQEGRACQSHLHDFRRTAVRNLERIGVTSISVRKVTLGAGTVELSAPRVDDLRRDEHGHRQSFTSHILPPYMRRSPKVAEVLPASS